MQRLEDEGTRDEHCLRLAMTGHVRMLPVEGREPVFRPPLGVARQHVRRSLGQKEGVAGCQRPRSLAGQYDPARTLQDGHEFEGRLGGKAKGPVTARLEPRAADAADIDERQQVRKCINHDLDDLNENSDDLA